MATKKAPPRRNTDVIRCENCGEEYSTTYKRCPFCDERPGKRGYPPVGSRQQAGGLRAKRSNPLQLAGLIISVVLIIAAVVIVFTTLSPLLFHRTSAESSSTSQSGSVSSVQTGDISLQGMSLNRTDVSLQAGELYQLTVTTDPADAQVTVEWSTSDEDIATVDAYGNITNVYKGSDTVPAVITASAGGQTAQCTVQCTGDGTGENITPSTSDQNGSEGGSSTSSGGTLAPNTEAVITGATGGLNIRSGPGTTYEAQASTTNGATVTVLGDAGDGWCKIQYSTGNGNYEQGYVMYEYLAAK